MYKIFLILGLFWTTCASAQFLPQTEDIPLMQGITLSDSDVFSFDSPSGQILTIEGETTLPPTQIQTFYAETLAAMGWQPLKANTYQRGADSLALSFPHKNIIHFEITLSNTDKN